MAAKQLGRMPYAWQLINFLKENDIKLQEAPFSVVAHKVLHCFPTMDELRQSGAEHVSLCSVPYYVVGADTTRPLDEQPLDDEDMEDAPPPEGTAEGDGNGDEEAAVAPALAQAQATPTRRQRGIYRQKPTCKRSFSCCQKKRRYSKPTALHNNSTPRQYHPKKTRRFDHTNQGGLYALWHNTVHRGGTMATIRDRKPSKKKASAQQRNRTHVQIRSGEWRTQS
mmetsp:Transcript_6262/g.19739  ORF Transcript_6262/g.19739 Transcript_6262/m.19739 type:complete len:224 (-) Transcript_6262:3267-3938(-)